MHPLLILLLFLQSHMIQTAFSQKKHDTNFFNRCPPTRCSESGPEIRYPYRLNSSPKSCGAPGMDLTCSPEKDIILTLPKLGTTKVHFINYKEGYVTVELGDAWPSCLLLTNQTVLSRMNIAYAPMFTTVSVITCPANFTLNEDSLAGPVSCLSSPGKYVYVVSTDASMDEIPSSCMVLQSNMDILLRSEDDAKSGGEETWATNVNDFIVRRLVSLLWVVTDDLNRCLVCETGGRQCGYDAILNETFCKPHEVNVNVKAISAISSVVFVLILSIPAALFYRSRKADKERATRLRIEQFLSTYKINKPTRYTFREVKKITRHFRDKLGQGGFGSVYKGELSNGLPVAVKMLERSKGAGEDFINEVATIGRIHHVNIVRLLGYCSEGTRRALVYEFMPNDSLEKYIVSRKNNEHLKMEKLLEISIGIARGIEYLHEGCTEQILHFDIKPHNILLDDNLDPKIADFGLAKLCLKDQSAIVMTAARGTMGYIAPEVFSRNFGTVSYKSDVFSFGMLLLELIGGKKSITTDPDFQIQSDVYFPELVYNRLIVGEDLELGMEITASEMEIARKVIIVAFWCIQWNPADRPSMTRVVNMLLGNLDNLEVPPTPFVSSQGF